MTDPLLDSLRRAVAAAPTDLPLRVHLAEQLLAGGHDAEAVTEAAAVLQLDPANASARALMTRALGAGPTRPTDPQPESPTATSRANVEPASPADAEPRTEPKPSPGAEFDWSAAEAEVHGVAEPMFVNDAAAPDPTESAFDIVRADVTLADVGGMQAVKERLEAAFLAPLRNPELRRLYAKSLRGGLLLYGPPGCGKTFVARALAGELGAKFLSVGLSDILDPFIGNTERNLHEAFQLARREAPCVLFLDEVDALAQRRAQTRNSGLRGAVNQLLTELDGIDGMNEGVFVLAATNQPWDVDPAMRRPGRLDRTVLVLPPDEPARQAIFRHHLAQRPVEGVDLKKLAAQSDGLSGADIAYCCELAAERALLAGVRSGHPKLIGMAELTAALREVQPSTTGWLDSARNVVLFGNEDGTYNELKAYLKKARRL